MNLTTVAVPNLIAHDLVIVNPMSSMSGYITYIEYTRSTAKGATKGGELISNPFGFGDVDVNYTGATVVETAEEAGKTKWNASGCFDKDGKFHLEKAALIAYAHGEYFTLGKRLGNIGFSTNKKKKNGNKKSQNHSS